MSDVGLLMSDEYNFVEHKEFTVSKDSETKKTDSNDKAFNIIKIIFCILCFILVGEFVVYKYVMPSFKLPEISINGLNNYSAEDISDKLSVMNCNNWFDFDVEMAASIISSEAGFEKVVVEKKFPNKILLEVVEREPVAVTFIEEEGVTTPVQIDKNGVLFPIKNRELLDSNEIPIISGLSIEHMSGGMRISSKYRALIERITKINETGNNFFAGISEICVIQKEVGNYELELIPTQSKIKVLMDPRLNEESLKYMMIALDVINLLDVDVSEIDLRYGSVSCKNKLGVLKNVR